MSDLLLRAAGLVVVAVVASGCSPSCQTMCTKLDRCNLLDATATVPECTIQCTRELGATKDTDPEAEQFDDFAHERTCIGTSSCDDIAAGTCFDRKLFPFAPSGS